MKTTFSVLYSIYGPEREREQPLPGVDVSLLLVTDQVVVAAQKLTERERPRVSI